MEVKALYGFTLLLVLVGMIIGVGVLVLDKYATAVKHPSPITNESVSMTAGVGTFANDDVTAVREIVNSTKIYIRDNISSSNQWNFSATQLFSGGAYTGGGYNVSYTYLADTQSTTAAGNSRDEIGTIASTWLGLIITIAILAIILTLVIRSFAGGRR